MKTLQRTAELWADQIMNGYWDNGDAIQNVFGSLLRAQSAKPTNEQIETFKRVLIEEAAKQLLDLSECINLGVDYGADHELEEACKQAGISTALLPIKSQTYTYHDNIKYKFGYGQPLKTEFI